jgi:hypothetical protein
MKKLTDTIEMNCRIQSESKEDYPQIQNKRTRVSRTFLGKKMEGLSKTREVQYI